jgi:hypothetical protein
MAFGQLKPTVGLLSARPSSTGGYAFYYSTDDAGGTMAQDLPTLGWTNQGKRGLLASSTITANSSAFPASTPTDISGLDIASVTATSRPIKLTFSGMWQSSSTSAVAFLYIWLTGPSNSIQQVELRAPVASQPYAVSMSVTITPGAGAQSFGMGSIGPASGTVVLVSLGSYAPCTLMAEEV